MSCAVEEKFGARCSRSDMTLACHDFGIPCRYASYPEINGWRFPGVSCTSGKDTRLQLASPDVQGLRQLCTGCQNYLILFAVLRLLVIDLSMPHDQHVQVGEFQSYDQRALASLAASAATAGHPEWGYTGPHDSGEYNSHPEVNLYTRRDTINMSASGWRK